MKTLWVNTNFMHPTTKGGQIRTLEMLRHLHQRHEIAACAADGWVQDDHIEARARQRGAGLIERFGAGRVVPAGDIEALTEAVREVLADPEPARAGAERARSELTWEAAAAAHLAVY